MATLGEFHDMVRLTLKKGTTLDNVFPSRVRQAVRWIERNFTFQYMKRIGTVTLDLASEFPWAVETPSKTWKSIDLVRIVDGSSIYPLTMDPDYNQQLTFPTERPTRYVLDGVERIMLNSMPDKDYYIEVFWNQYTSWGVDDNFTCWLLENAEDLLLYQSMLHMALYLSDDRMASTYLAGRDEALRTLMVEAQERTATGLNDLRMGFSPEGGLWLPE